MIEKGVCCFLPTLNKEIVKNEKIIHYYWIGCVGCNDV